MEPDAAHREALGQRLFDAGWRQGSLFQPGDVQLAFLAHEPGAGADGVYRRPIRADERLVLVSQDCDLVAKTSTEPYVEALLCDLEPNSGRIADIERNSARAFLVDPATNLVALARYRVHLHKEVLEGIRPQPWPSDPTRFHRFVRWLGRRFTRPAVHERVIEHFHRPLENTLRQIRRRQKNLAAALTSAVHEIRIELPEDYDLPLKIRVLMVLAGEELTEEQADALAHVEREIHEHLDPAHVEVLSFDWRTDDELSVAEYLATVPLFSESLTYHGGDVPAGAEPLPPL